MKTSRAQLAQGYPGASALSQTTQSLFLEEGARFRLEEKTFRAITGLGGSEDIRQTTGTWKLAIDGDDLRLVLSREGRVFANWRLEGHDAPTVRLDSEPWRKETR